jgi:hypothetical protein
MMIISASSMTPPIAHAASASGGHDDRQENDGQDEQEALVGIHGHRLAIVGELQSVGSQRVGTWEVMLEAHAQ